MGKAALILKNVADVINCWWTSSHMAFLRKMYSHVIQSKERCIILVIKIFKRDTHTERKDSVKDSFSQSLYIYHMCLGFCRCLFAGKINSQSIKLYMQMFYSEFEN